jgi:2-iminobutanoate/2-iminopropanoate deaminase
VIPKASLGAYTFPHDCIGEGSDTVFDRLARAGLGSATVAVADHTSRDIFPLNGSLERREEGTGVRQQIQTDAAPRPGGPYSQAMRVGDLVFTAGQGPIDPATGTVRGETIEEQTDLTIDNLSALLEAAGTSLDHVVKATVHLANLADFPAFNRVYERRFPDPKPVRTTVGSQLLGILVEIDLIAEMPPGTETS